MIRISQAVIVVLVISSFSLSLLADDVAMAKITAGEYRPLYLSATSPRVKVDEFWLDITPVTNRLFFEFIQKNLKWEIHNVPSIFSEAQYLSHWQKMNHKSSDSKVVSKHQYKPSMVQLNSPVTKVSWFAAQAYCQSIGKRLPTISEWEYAAAASEKQKNGSLEEGYNQRILRWYSRPTTNKVPSIGLNPPNYWGVHDLHGLIWEWVEDFNSNLVTGESRGDSSLDQNLFCGSGAAGAADPSDYAAFMRYAYRTSLKAPFTQASLGFRCATSEELIK